MPICIAVRIRSGEGSDASRTMPTSGKLTEISRASSITGTVPSASCSSDHVDVQAPQRARELLGVGDALEHLEVLALGREGGGRRGQLRIGDGEQQALAHEPPPRL